MNLLFIDDYYRSFLGSEFTFTRYGFTFTKKIMTDLVSITIAIAAFMFLNQIRLSYFIPNEGHLTGPSD